MKTPLPIGSVVLLKEAKKRIMIVGLNQKDAETDKVWDYSAVLYPEGLLDSNNIHLFNEAQIDRMYFIGFQDAEGLKHYENLISGGNNENQQDS